MKPLAALAVFLVLLSGCSGEASRGRPEAPSAPVGVGGPAEEAGPEEHILYAYRLLRSYHVEELDSARLLGPAWEGAVESAGRRFELPSALPSPSLGGPDAETAFAAAIRGLVTLAPADFNRQELAHDAIEAMADALGDNHTYFMLPEPYQLYLANETIGLAYSGLERREGILVWYVYEDGPAARIGLRPGDMITSIDGRFVGRGQDEDDEEPRFRAGVPVTLTVERLGVGVFEVPATPELTQRRIIDARIEGDFAYIRLYRFPQNQTLLPDGRTLVAYLDGKMAELRARGVRGWVLDLRNNPGGSEPVAANVAGRFGLTGPLVENKRRNGSTATIAAIGESGLAGLPLAILTNENSASSSELVSSALQQAGLARVFGEKTAGVVNTARSWSLVGGAGLFITTEKAFAGAEKAYLDGRGVFPDEAVTLSRHELAAGFDTQLARAIEWLRSGAEAPAGVR